MSKSIGIVGAGPVGSLLAISLARRGHTVKLYERRTDMRINTQSAGRSINLALSTRGLHALDSCGLKEKVLSRAIAMKGRMIHLADGTLNSQPYGRNDSECIYSVSRGELNALLMTEAETRHRVKIEFDRKISQASDIPGHDAIFGTDGSASALRAETLSKTGGQISERLLNYGYKELTLPAGPSSAFQIEKNALHIWPRGSFMLIALPNFDGSFTCTLFLPFEGANSFASLQTPAAVSQFFTKHFPEAQTLIPTLEQDFFSHPTGQMVTVKCAPWCLGGEILLLGDAAHAVVPFFGQGMNAGFEDVSILSQKIDEGESNWKHLFESFSTQRKPDADAIADLAEANFVEMRDRVADPRFQLERKVEKILEREFPERYFSRYTLVTFTRLPYSLAQTAGRIEDTLLTELCRNLDSPEQVDLALARQLIEDKLGNLFNKTHL